MDENWNAQAGGTSSGTGDCDDNSAVINPQSNWHPDSDGDSFGNPAISLVQCLQPAEYFVLNASDCDDNDANIYPGGPPVRIYGGIPSYFYYLQDAYDAAQNGAAIESQNAIIGEYLYFDLNKTVHVQGGFDCAYSIITGVSTIYGTLSITDGSVTLEDIEVQPPPEYSEY